MNPVDAYLADLRAVLGDRLPPVLKETRLRETRGHLLMAARDSSEAEAVRRYGRPRAVANGLVRSYRRYDTRSVWRLALPMSLTLVLISVSFGLASTYLNDGIPIVPLPWSLGILGAYILAFAARVIQTRRWLVIPMVLVYAAGVALATVVRHVYPVSFVSYHENGVFVRRRAIPAELQRDLSRTPDWGTPRIWLDEALLNAPGLARSGAMLLTLNAALGLATLSDRRRA